MARHPPPREPRRPGQPSRSRILEGWSSWLARTSNPRHQAAPLGAPLHALVMRHFSPVVGLFNAPPLPETHCRNGRLNVPRRVGPFADNVARSDGIRGQETTNVVA